MAESAGEKEGTEDDVKRRFREALERKRGASADKHAESRGKGKVRGVHGKADHQRQFRRKSG
ncbi:DUF5302 domain-containing protein [Spirillospora sp. CA-294931]|uniref:DUF5302 domain-containing protein n=1 Tax=Spirillospora sp. CA-294931 TaxID=3240042 RepID=UPI003D910FAC